MSPRKQGIGGLLKFFSAVDLHQKSYGSRFRWRCKGSLLSRDGVPIYHARCSTGRSGYSTKRGEFVITNKERNHRSTIYHVEMPYFMRLSCLDFGMHAGYVPNYPHRTVVSGYRKIPRANSSPKFRSARL